MGGAVDLGPDRGLRPRPGLGTESELTRREPKMTVPTPAGALAGRLVLARAIVADYAAVCEAWRHDTTPADVPRVIAVRLHVTLAGLIEAVDAAARAGVGARAGEVAGNGVVTRVNRLPGTHVRVDGVAEVVPEDVGIVLGALATAADCLEERASQTCLDCGTDAAELCLEHEADLADATSYRSLSRALGDDR